MKLPKQIYVAWEEPESGDPFLNASNGGIADVLDGDGPTNVGVYRLVNVVLAVKELKTTEIRRAK